MGEKKLAISLITNSIYLIIWAIVIFIMGLVLMANAIEIVIYVVMFFIYTIGSIGFGYVIAKTTSRKWLLLVTIIFSVLLALYLVIIYLLGESWVFFIYPWEYAINILGIIAPCLATISSAILFSKIHLKKPKKVVSANETQNQEASDSE